MNNSVTEIVRNLLKPVLEELQLDIYDLQFVKEGKDRYLRVFLDKEDTVTVEDCEQVSRYLSKQLDEKDPIKEQYFLEVSSPGAERKLKTDRDFERFRDHLVEVRLFTAFEELKLYQGRLKEKNEEEVVIDMDGREIRLPLSSINYVKNLLEF